MFRGKTDKKETELRLTRALLVLEGIDQQHKVYGAKTTMEKK